jgi:hypothetical protein
MTSERGRRSRYGENAALTRAHRTLSTNYGSHVPRVQINAVVNLDVPGPTISRHLYGHFAEHLGRCIYDGFYVGEDSDIPHVGGIRRDVVEALRALHIPNLRWPGGCFADEYHWRDGIGPEGVAPHDGEYPLGQCRREQPFRYARVHGVV